VSGIDYSSLIDKLMALETQPRTNMANQQTVVDNQRTAVNTLTSNLMTLRSFVSAIGTSNSLSAAKATSSASDLLTATAASGAAPGTYQFKVARLASAQQLISAGLSDTDTTPLGAGTLTLQSAQAKLTSDTRLDLLNGQQGVRRGSIRITDRAGDSAVIDLSTAVTVDDVLNAINSNTSIQVQASTTGGQLVLTDQTGEQLSRLAVKEVGQGHTAADLGLLTNVAADTITGGDLVSVNANTQLALLNQGLGVANQAGQDDFQIQLRDGTTFAVNIDGAKTLGDVVNEINAASHASANPDALVASINSAGDGLQLADGSTGGGTLTVAAVGDSAAAHDLGLLGSDTAGAGTITGHALLGGLQSVLLDRLNGGSGVGRGSISITDRAGGVSTINLSAANTIQDVIDAINDPGNGTANVTAALNQSGNGLVITDHTAGSGHLVIADVGQATTATDLKITTDAAVSQASSGDLNRQFVSANTQLADMNSGRGVTLGKFTITNSAGASATVNLTQGSVETLADVIAAVNSSGLHVTASINTTGDGLLIQDNSGGSGSLTIADVSGTAAHDLNIAGPATNGAIDGSSEMQISVSSSDTLSSLVAKINSSGAGLSATIINDGSPTNPYRLSLVADNSGAAGARLIDTGTTGLSLSETNSGADAVLSSGQPGSGQPLLITQNSNTVSGVISNVTLNLLSADPSRTVTVTVAADSSSLVSSLQQFASGFNSVMSTIAADTKYDTTTDTGAVLQGDASVINAQSRLFGMIFQRFNTGSQYQTLSSLGFSLDTNNQLSLDQDKFNQAFAANPDAVRQLLTSTTNGAVSAMQKTLDSLAAKGSGALALESNRLDNQYNMYQDELNTMDVRLTAKRDQLTTTFNNLETAIATMQSQQSAVTNLANLVASFTNSTSSSSSSSSS
jgi:flagellar hook-associated protein 2